MNSNIFFIIAATLITITAGEAQSTKSAHDIAERIIVKSEEYAEAGPLLLEVDDLISKSPSLELKLKEETGRTSVNNNLFWAAARLTDFDDSVFRSTYPNFSNYGNLLFLSKTELGGPRIIFQTNSQQALGEVTMLFGSTPEPQQAPIASVGKWNDPERLATLRGKIFNFDKNSKGLYLYSVAEGRETTGASTIRNILFWLRIEAEILVPERFEGYDVPVGETRNHSHLKITATPTDPILPSSAKEFPNQNKTQRASSRETKKAAPETTRHDDPEGTESESHPMKSPSSTICIISISAILIFAYIYYRVTSSKR